MQPAAEQLAEQLSNIAITPPSIPVIHNVDALSHGEPSAIRDALAAQLYRPVRWVECVRAMQAQGVGTLVEAGPGKVLAGLTKRIEKTLTAIPVQNSDDLDKAIASIS